MHVSLPALLIVSMSLPLVVGGPDVAASAATRMAEPILSSLPGVSQQAEIQPLDVNEASAEALQEVPGIGPAIARRIVEFRQEHGRYERLEDLLHVRGIGSKTLEKLRPYLKVSKPDDTADRAGSG